MSESKTYSLNNEEYRFGSVHDAIDDAVSDGQVQQGDLVTVYEGEPVPATVKIRSCWLIEQMQEQVYEECGEFGEGFLEDVTSEQEAELQTGLDSLIENWLDAHNLHPTCYTVTNISEHKYKITKLTDLDFDYEEA